MIDGRSAYTEMASIINLNGFKYSPEIADDSITDRIELNGEEAVIHLGNMHLCCKMEVNMQNRRKGKD